MLVAGGPPERLRPASQQHVLSMVMHALTITLTYPTLDSKK